MLKDEGKFTVIRDTAEKNGWIFNNVFDCAGMVDGNLNTGDYTIIGAEDKVIIERKGSVAELAGNITESRFEEELKRLEAFEGAYLIAEFSFEDILKFPENMPPKVRDKIKISSQYIIKMIAQYQMVYKTKFLFCGSRYGAFLMARSILKRFHEKYNLGK